MLLLDLGRGMRGKGRDGVGVLIHSPASQNPYTEVHMETAFPKPETWCADGPITRALRPIISGRHNTWMIPAGQQILPRGQMTKDLLFLQKGFASVYSG